MNPLWSRYGFVAMAVGVGALGLGGCGPRASHPAQETPLSVGGYLPPPTLKAATREADGGVHLAGGGPPDAEVRLNAPDGAHFEVHSGLDGAWSLDIPSAPAPRLFAIEAKTAVQTVRGEGALALMPAPSVPALMLRAGYAAAPVGAPSGGLRLVAFDYDGGGAAASGLAPAGSPVRLSIDGAIVGLAKADAQGRFAVLAIDPRRGVPPGDHTIRIETPQGLAVERRISVTAPAIPADKAFTASTAEGGWTLSWRLPGGGAQSSLVFDAATAPPAVAS